MRLCPREDDDAVVKVVGTQCPRQVDISVPSLIVLMMAHYQKTAFLWTTMRARHWQ